MLPQFWGISGYTSTMFSTALPSLRGGLQALLFHSTLHCNPLRAQNQLQNDEIGEFSVESPTNAGPILQNAEIVPPDAPLFP